MRQTYESTAKSFPADRKELFPVGCVIMASGLGRRFGGNKLLSDFHGKALISHAIEKAGAFPFAETVVVTRYEEIAGLCAMENIPFLLHRLPGTNATLRLGLCRLLADTENQMQAQADMEDQPAIQTPLSFADRIIRTGLSGCLFWPADQPLVTLESLNSLVRTFFQFPGSICRLGYDDIAGSPILFGQKYFPELMALPEDKGGSFLAQKYPAQVKIIPARNKYELCDIDTPEDLAFLSRHF